MRIAASLVLPAALLLLSSCGAGLGGGEPAILKSDVPAGASMTALEHAFALQVFELVNLERARAGLPPLEWSPEAADVAYDHCVDMRLRGYYDHVTPEGLTPCDRLTARGLSMVICAGENIALGNTTPADVMAAWMGSPAHRAVILKPLFTHVGVGVHAGADGPWWTQDFYTPLDR